MTQALLHRSRRHNLWHLLYAGALVMTAMFGAYAGSNSTGIENGHMHIASLG